jgi:4-oxalocrotonate tautomerase
LIRLATAASDTTRPSHTFSMISSWRRGAPVFHQQREQGEHLRLDRDGISAGAQLDFRRVELETTEPEQHDEDDAPACYLPQISMNSPRHLQASSCSTRTKCITSGGTVPTAATEGESHASRYDRRHQRRIYPKQKQELIAKVTAAMIEVEGENMRSVTWVRVNEFEGGDWAIGGRALRAADVHALQAGKAA